MALPNEAELAELTEKLNREFRELGRATPETSKAMMEAETQIANFNFKVEVGTKVLEKLASAAIGTQKAMYKGEKGAAAFNQSITDMSDAAQIAAVGLSLLIPGGPLMKAAVAGITYLATSAMKAGTELTKTANEQSDKLYNAFQKMSKAGAAGSDGMTGVFGDIQKLGLGIQDLDGYISLINDSSRDLALFGGSVTAGRKAFANMNAEMKPFTEQLYNAGLNQEDIAQGAMSYLKIQTQLGASQTMTSKQLAEGAKKYLIEQDALTKLTGMTRADAEAARQAALSEQRFAAKIAAMKRSSDPKERAAAEELIKANTILESQSKEAAQGFRDLSTGMITTDAAQKALTSSNGEALTQATEIASGNATAIEGVQKMGTAFGKFAEDMNATAQSGVFEDFSIKFADAVKLGIFASKDLEAEYKKINQDLVDQGVTGKKAKDELQQTQTEIRLEQKEAMLATQGFVQTLVGPATDAMLKLAKAANAAAQALNPTAGEQKPLRKTGIDAVDNQMEKERASPEYAAYQKNQEKIKKDQEAAAKKWAEDMPWWLGGDKKSSAPVTPPGGGSPSTSSANGGGSATAATSTSQAKPASSSGGTSAPPAAPATNISSAPKGGAVSVSAPSADDSAAPPKSPPLPDGAVQSGKTVRIGDKIHQGGDPAWRLNNPGNVSYSGLAKQFGAIGKWMGTSDDQQKKIGIAIMPSLEAGRALKDALWRRPKYNDGTIDAGAQQWAEGAKKFGYGSPYARDLAKAAGATLDTMVSTLSDTQLRSMMEKQTQLEGFKAGKIIQAAAGGIFDGPKSGYAATLHGNEAVIPLKDGAVPVSMSQEFNMTAANLGELVNQMKYNMSVQDQMLAVLQEIRRSQSTMTDNTGKMVALAA